MSSNGDFRLPPETAARIRQMLEPLERAMRAYQENVADMATAVAPALERMAEASKALTPQMEEVGRRLEPLLREIRRATEAFRRSLPDNWEGLPDPEELAKWTAAGVPVAWVPRSDTLYRMLETDVSDRDEFLAAHYESILEDCEALLQRAPRTEQTDALNEVVTCLRQGQQRSGQALAACVITDLLVQGFRFPHMSGARRSIEAVPTDLEEVALLEYRRVMVLRPVGVALTRFDPGIGSVPPEDFNRHATVHTVHEAQFTAPNALVSLLLATSLLAELWRESLEQSG